MSVASVQSRFILLERPLASPGKCAVCGTTSRPVIDFNFNLDWYGAVYFCIDCLTEVARVVGLVPVKDNLEGERESTETILNYCFKNDLRLVKEEEYVRILDGFKSIAGICANMQFSDLNDLEDTSTDNQLTIDSFIEDDISSGNEGPTSISGSGDRGPKFEFTE